MIMNRKKKWLEMNKKRKSLDRWNEINDKSKSKPENTGLTYIKLYNDEYW